MSDTSMVLTAMTPAHPRGDEFYNRLEGPEGCNFHKDKAGETHWACAGDANENPQSPEMVHILSRAILMKMGLSNEEIAASLAYFCEHGGYCDCEVLWNVEGSEPLRKDAFNCVDCGKDTSGTEYYSVKDEVWEASGLSPDGGMLCLADLERRIGRWLTLEDFKDCPMGVPEGWDRHVVLRTVCPC